MQPRHASTLLSECIKFAELNLMCSVLQTTFYYATYAVVTYAGVPEHE
jgi:hypothetical protein